MNSVAPLRIGVSACLLGERVRYDGDQRLSAGVEWLCHNGVECVAVCPEVEMGLGVPREPIQLEGDPESPRLVSIRTRRDLTMEMETFTRRRVQSLIDGGISGFVLKRNSPSCGLTAVPVHEAGAGGSVFLRRHTGPTPVPAATGRGAFARALMAMQPELPVTEEDALEDPVFRRQFLDRVQTYHRLICSRMEGA